METDRSSQPSLKPYWIPALLVLAAIVGALLWVLRAEAVDSLRPELTGVLVAGGLATVVATAALYVRTRAAQVLESRVERFLMMREAQVHAGIVWIACFVAAVAAIVALRVSLR
jgi:hypothetical protein